MTRTLNRRPLSVSTNSKDYPQSYFFNQSQFNGICIDKNDVNVDMQSFEDAENIYVDENGILTSRAPFKFVNNRFNILNTWHFGNDRLYLLKNLCVIDGTTITFLSELSRKEFTDMYDKLYVVYTLQGRTKSKNIVLNVSVFDSNYDTFVREYTDLIPKFFCEQIEDKVFIWCAGFTMLVYRIDTDEFEDAGNHLYVPIYETVVNSIHNRLEDKNIFANAYYSRYLYSATSDVNFMPFIKSYGGGKELRVSIETGNGSSSYLYDCTATDDIRDLLIRPKYDVIPSMMFSIKMVSTPRANIFLRYDYNYDTIEVSFDGVYFKALPEVPTKTGEKRYDILLTEDGMHVVLLSNQYIYYCGLVKDETDDIEFVDTFNWQIMSYYLDKEVTDAKYASIHTDFIYAHFKTIANFSYIANLTQHKMERPGVSTADEHDVYCVVVEDDILSVLNTSAIKSDTTLTNIRSNCKYSYASFFNETSRKYEYTGAFIYSYEYGSNATNANEKYYETNLIVFKEDTSAIVKNTLSPLDTNSVAYDAIKYANMSLSVDNDSCEIVATFIPDKDKMYVRYYRQVCTFSKSDKGELTLNLEKKGLSGYYNRTVRKEHYMLKLGGKYLSSDGILDVPSDYLRFSPWPISDDKIVPLTCTENGVWLLVGDKLWTSVRDNDVLYLDVISGVTKENDEYIVEIPGIVPDLSTNIIEYYFAFSEPNRLLVTQTKLDDEKLKDGIRDFLLYSPRDKEQAFVDKITAMHSLSDTMLGIFTNNAIYNITFSTLDDGTDVYSKPVRSRLPIGCRDGDSVLTTDDGQTIIFATPRGIAALSPQDFVATTEKSISYLTENIYAKYHEFYNLDVNEFKTNVRIVMYNKYILFYKYMHREVLVLDVQSGIWWNWRTQYPVVSMFVDSYLYVYMHVDFLLSDRLSLQNVLFVYADKNIDTEYKDDIVEGTTCGDNNVITIGSNQYATPAPVSSRIDWYFTSQKLHFGQINNYKFIRGININARGDGILEAELYNKAFRDISSPESYETIHFTINKLRTFATRLNLLRVMNFQYTLQNDKSSEAPQKLLLNSLCIKYEVKERIR